MPLSAKMQLVQTELAQIGQLVKKSWVQQIHPNTPSMNIHVALRKLLILAQIFGYMPIRGITKRHMSFLAFEWYSWKSLYAFVTFLGALFLSVMKLLAITTAGLSIFHLDKFVFFLYGVATSVIFVWMARGWARLMQEWYMVEKAMDNYGWTKGLNGKIDRITYGFMGIALVEHILAQGNKLHLAFLCKGNVEEAFEYFLGDLSYSYVFHIFNYNIVLALILQAINLQLTFAWTYNDLFIMVTSVALAYRYKQVTQRLKSTAEAQVENEAVWRALRVDYNRLGLLCNTLNNHQSNLVLLSYSTNIFFILIQLFNSLRPMRNTLERFYFYCSFALLIARMVCVCLYGAMVNEESKKPLLVLTSVEAGVYNKEIERFIQQIGAYDVAISGKNFFNITRGLILNIAGAVVTYELVLIQFNGDFLENTPDKRFVCPTFA